MNKISKLLFMLTFSLSFTGLLQQAHAEVQTEVITYQADNTVLQGYIAFDDAIDGSRPGVIVVHEWWGHNDYARRRAEQLAEMGYVAFALDMYGEGKVADHPDSAKEFMSVVASDMEGVGQDRFKAAMDVLKQHPLVEDENLAAIGYCFGGGTVLHMARFGVDLKGVVSFHGSLGTDMPAKEGDVKAKVLVFNGAADPFVPPEQVNAFKAEMKNADVDFQFVNYENVKHSFTNPGATAMGEKFNMPLEYDAQADQDSWEKTKEFLADLFS